MRKLKIKASIVILFFALLASSLALADEKEKSKRRCEDLITPFSLEEDSLYCSSPLIILQDSIINIKN